MQTVQLNYKKFGNGHPLIILHGLFGSSANWLSIARQLGKHFSAYALDLRNHGNSPHSPVFNYPIMAEDVRMFCNNENISNVTIIGHSMGGKVAMQFAEFYPDMVRRLIIVDISPFVYFAYDYRHLLSTLIHLDLSAFTRQKEILMALKPAIPSIDIRYFLMKNLARNKEGIFYWKINLEAIYANIEGLRNGIELSGSGIKEALFLRGENSNYITDISFELIRERIPSATLKTIQGASHWVHVDAPKEFIQAILDYKNEYKD